MDEVTIPKKEYERLKLQARLSSIDPDLFMQLVESVKDIKSGRIRRVK